MAHRIDRDANFANATHLLRSNECTPEPEGDFVGILLNAPREVGYSGTRPELDPRDCNFMICGMATLAEGALGLPVTSMARAVLFLATNTRTHTTYTAKIEPVRNALPPPRALLQGANAGVNRPNPADVEITTYFNLNLAAAIALPAIDADYLVHATLGPHQSNVLDVKVRKRGGGSPWPT